MDEEFVELSPADYLRDLAGRIFRIPAMYGVDGYDFDRLHEIARDLDKPKQSED